MMKYMAVIAALLLCPTTTQAAVEEAFYDYAHNDAEYIVTLPDAPTATTIWSTDPVIPYIGEAHGSGAIGETAVLKRVDILTEDIFEVSVTFLKASRPYLAALTDEQMKTALMEDYKTATLESQKFNVMTDEAGRKRALLTGFTVDRQNHAFYNASFFLPGKQSIEVIRVTYSVENKKFGEYYKSLSEGIRYYAP